MRKLLRIIVALLLCAGFCISAPAASADVGNSQEIDVMAGYEIVSVTPACYSVDLTWSDMTFTYTGENIRIWNAGDHSYRTGSSGSWDRTEAEITVTNHSNVDVQVTVTYTPVAGTGITGLLRNGTGMLKAGAVGDYEGADSMTATLMISGVPTAAVAGTQMKIGSLRVSIR